MALVVDYARVRICNQGRSHESLNQLKQKALKAFPLHHDLAQSPE